MGRRKLSYNDVIRFADKVLDYFGLMLGISFQDGREYKMNWREIVLSKSIIEHSEEAMKLSLIHI